MGFIDFSKCKKSPELQGVVVEHILLSCIEGVSINELVSAKQRTVPSKHNMKKYLFHMINYELISYSGQTQRYAIEEGGLDLLDWIEKEKTIMAVGIQDIVITIE